MLYIFICVTEPYFRENSYLSKGRVSGNFPVLTKSYSSWTTKKVTALEIYTRKKDEVKSIFTRPYQIMHDFDEHTSAKVRPWCSSGFFWPYFTTYVNSESDVHYINHVICGHLTASFSKEATPIGKVDKWANDRTAVVMTGARNSVGVVFRVIESIMPMTVQKKIIVS